MEKCTEYRLAKEQEKELADLNMGNVDVNEGAAVLFAPPLYPSPSRPGRSLRSRAPMPKKRGGRVEMGERSSSESAGEDAEQRREEAHRDYAQTLSRLKGIVDSDGQSSD